MDARAIFGAFLISFWLTTIGLNGAEPRPNRVLEFDGVDSAMELPRGAFTNLTAATVEGWVKWDEFGWYSRFFDFGGIRGAMTVNQGAKNGELRFEIWAKPDGFFLLNQPEFLVTNHWWHIAAVSGPGGAKLYVNGTLVYSMPTTNSFSNLAGNRHNFIGRSNWKAAGEDGDDLKGQVDEFRVWNVERTEEQIRAEMSKRLSGKEPGLVGLWNFDNPENPGEDATGHGLQGVPLGKVSVSLMEPARDVVMDPVSFRVMPAGDNTTASAMTFEVIENGQVISSRVFPEVADIWSFARLRSTNSQIDLHLIADQAEGWLLNRSVRSGTQVSAPLALQRRNSVSGSVSALDGSPLITVVVQLTSQEATPELLYTTHTDSRGQFRFTHLRPGKYQARIHTPGELVGFNNGQAIEVQPGKEIPAIDFIVPPFKKGRWKSYGEADGLPAGSVRALFEAEDGAMWFGTTSGLARFDGKSFRVFTTRDGLANNWISGIAADRRQRLWIVTAGGVSCLDGEKFVKFTGTNSPPAGDYEGIGAAPNGEIWMGSEMSGVVRFDGQSFFQYTTNNGFPARGAWKVASSRDNHIWFATSAGLVQFDGTNFIRVLERARIKSGAPDSPIEAPDGSIWFGSGLSDGFGTGVWRYDRTKAGSEAGAFKNFSRRSHGIANNYVTSIAFESESIAWIITQMGVSRFDGKTVVNYRIGDGLVSDAAAVGRRDRNGAMWFGTAEGASKFEPDTLRNFSEADGLPRNAVQSLHVGKSGELWIGTGGGIASYNGRQFRRFSDSGPRLASAIAETPDGKIWAAGESLHYFDEGRWNRQRLHRQLDNSRFECLDVDSNGVLWFGCRSGEVGYLENVAGELLSRTVNAENNSPVWDILGEGDQTVTAGIGGVLNFFRKLDRTWGSRLIAGIPPEFSDSVTPSSLFRAGPDELWVGTSKGPFRVRHRKLENLTDPDQGGGGVVTDIARDRDGFVWAGTSAGARFFDGESWAAGLTRSHGLDAAFILAIAQDHEGFIWLGTRNGLTRYRKRKVSLPMPRLTIRTESERLVTGEIIPLKTGERATVSWSLTDLHTAPQSRRYRWQLLDGRRLPKELSKDWQARTSLDRIDWSTNKPGRFTFAVQYIDQDLNYSPPALAVFEVSPPWYLNARIAGPLLTGNLLLAWLAFYSTHKAALRKKEAARLQAELLLQERNLRKEADSANEAKSFFLANMSHELRTPLNAILGYTDMVKEELADLEAKHLITDLDKVTAAAKHQLGLVNDILDLSKIEAGKMDLFVEEFDAGMLVDEVAGTVAPLVEKNGNLLVVEKDGIGMIKTDQTKLRQVLLNLLSNASKFTEHGTITLRAKSENSHLQFEIEDTGIGMTQEQLGKLFQAFSQADASTAKKYGGTGLGLALSRKFVELMDGELTVRSEANKGSAFTVHLPITPRL